MIQPMAPPYVPREARVETPAGATIGGAPPFLLIVEDHEPSLRMLTRVLALAGFPCLAVKSAAEALALCDAHRPNVVLTDYSMPVIDGLTLARWLRSRYQELPVLLMTANDVDHPSIELASRQRDVAEILTKPIDCKELTKFLFQYW